MHKLISYICDELEEIERKAEKGGKLTMQEVQYADMLAHLKKNILTSDAMMESEEYDDNNSYARGRMDARRDSRGRYSRDGYRMTDGVTYRGYSRDDAKHDIMTQLRDMERDADDESKQMIRKWIKQIEER